MFERNLITMQKAIYEKDNYSNELEKRVADIVNVNKEQSEKIGKLEKSVKEIQTVSDNLE